MDLGDLIDEKEPPEAEFDVNTTSDGNKDEQNTAKTVENQLEVDLQGGQTTSEHGDQSLRKNLLASEHDVGKVKEVVESDLIKSQHIDDKKIKDDHQKVQGEQVETEQIEGDLAEHLQIEQRDGEHIDSEPMMESEHVKSDNVEGENVEGEHLEGEHIGDNDLNDEHTEGEHVKREYLEGEHLEDEHVEGENVEGEHVEGEHVESEHVKGGNEEGENIEGEHVEGENLEGEYIEGENVEGKHLEGQHVDGEHLEGEHVESEHVEGEHLLTEHKDGEITEGENLEGEEKVGEEIIGEDIQVEEQLVEAVVEEENEYVEIPADPAAPYDLTDSKEALRPPYVLRPDQIAELETLWQLYQDYTPAYTTIDNYITIKELVYMLKCLNLMTHTPEQVQELIDFCVRPPNSKGHINFDQFTHICKIRFRDISLEEELRFALQVMDPDETGILDREFLKDVLATKGNRMGHRNLDNLIKEVDISQDGTIAIEDVVGTMAIDLNTDDLEMLRAAVYPPDKLLGHEDETSHVNEAPIPNDNETPSEDD